MKLAERFKWHFIVLNYYFQSFRWLTDADCGYGCEVGIMDASVGYNSIALLVGLSLLVRLKL